MTLLVAYLVVGSRCPPPSAPHPLDLGSKSGVMALMPSREGQARGMLLAQQGRPCPLPHMPPMVEYRPCFRAVDCSTSTLGRSEGNPLFVFSRTDLIPARSRSVLLHPLLGGELHCPHQPVNRPPCQLVSARHRHFCPVSALTSLPCPADPHRPRAVMGPGEPRLAWHSGWGLHVRGPTCPYQHHCEWGMASYRCIVPPRKFCPTCSNFTLGSVTTRNIHV
jgi:hypothetical protein